MGQATPLMLSVGIATVATCLIRKRSLANLGWQWGEWKYHWMSYLIPLFIVFLAYLLIWLTGVGELYSTEFLLKKKESYNLVHWNDTSIFIFHLALTSSVIFFVSFPSIIGEEIGWRGFLVPELSKFMSFGGVALISGLAWSVFHWPLIIKGLYGNDVTPLYYQLFFFTLFITSSGIIMTYLRLKTNSLWTGVIYHASSNVFVQKVFTPITVSGAESSWYIDEFGAAMAIVASCVSVYFWRKGQVEFSFRVRQT